MQFRRFAIVDTTTYAADSARDGIGYSADWVWSHPGLQVGSDPTLWTTTGLRGPMSCNVVGRPHVDWFPETPGGGRWTQVRG